MILRTSGPESFRLASRLGANQLTPNRAARHRLHFANLKLPATLYAFRTPRSHTGEDVVEYHLPGNPLLARLLLDHLIESGARQARPGEFTARAYFNGKTDLAAAEGVAAAIAARSDADLAGARRLAAGELTARLRPILEALADALALVEVSIDFAEEDVTVLTAADLQDRIDRIDAACHDLQDDTARFDRLGHEPVIVLAGRPNAGKSTLLNALAGHARAVVSEQSGTTRDALTARLPLRRGLAVLTDVAGLDPSGSTHLDRQMQTAAARAAGEADVLVLVRDATDSRPDAPLPRAADLVVVTKIDLLADQSAGHADAISSSAKSGANLDALRDRLDALAFGTDAGTLALNARHAREVAAARDALGRAAASVDLGAEVVALDLRDALDALGRVLGAVTPDDLLGRIFSTFCIGK